MKHVLLTLAIAALGSFNCQAQGASPIVTTNPPPGPGQPPAFAQLNIQNNTGSNWNVEIVIYDPTPTTAPAMGGVYRTN